MRSLGGALIVAAVVCLSTVLGVRAAGVPAARPAAGEASVQTGGDAETLVGIWACTSCRRTTVYGDDEGRPRPSPPTDAERLYQLRGDVLRVGVRPPTTDGEATGGHLYWEMLPPR